MDNVLKEPGQSEAVLINRAKVCITYYPARKFNLVQPCLRPRRFLSLAPFLSLQCPMNPTKNVVNLNGMSLVFKRNTSSTFARMVHEAAQPKGKKTATAAAKAKREEMLKHSNAAAAPA